MTSLHGLHGYREVIDTIQWGLRELGHSADYGVNTISPTATNIVFGMQMLSLESIANLPPDTIVYNFEQMRGLPIEGLKPQMFAAANRFRIWDYSEANLEVWASIGAVDVRLVPVGYAPILERIRKPELQDVDVLMYGSTGPERLTVLHRLCLSGLTTMYVSGMYGKNRDELISRAKIVVNASVVEASRIFEIVRVSYLLANRKAVVAVVDDLTVMEGAIRSAIKVTSMESLVGDCQALIGDDHARAALEERGHQAMQLRDIRTFLTSALGEA